MTSDDLVLPFGHLPGGLPDNPDHADGLVGHVKDGMVNVFALRRAVNVANATDPVGDESDELEVVAGFSMAHEDFVTMAKGLIAGVGRPPAATKTGRNDACPCGSGKKYKQCHGT